MQFLALVLSITLHVGLVAGMMLWPSGSNLKVDEAPVFISLVEGDLGGNNAPSSILGAAGAPAEKIAPSLPSKEIAPPSVPEPAPAPEEIPQVPKEIAKAEPPKAAEQAKPEPKPLPKPEPKPEPEPKAEVAQPEPKPEPKPKPKPEPKKPEPKKTAEKKPEPKKPAPKKTTEKKPAPKKPAPKKPEKLTAEQEIARALAEAKKNSGGFKGGGGGSGEGTGGGNLNDVYIGQVMMAVRPNWDFESATRVNFISHVRVKLNSRGQVLSASLAQSSGNAQYDASTVNAVLRTGEANMFPSPPTSAYHELLLVFTRDMM